MFHMSNPELLVTASFGALRRVIWHSLAHTLAC